MLHFIFPADPLNSRAVDEYFEPQRAAVLDRSYSTSLVADSVLAGGGGLRGIPEGALVVYRGWMITAAQYERLEGAVRAAGGRPLTTLHQYLATHHLPNWYPLVREFTPETRVFAENADLPSALRALGWQAFFVKDYVKSLKTSVGSRIADSDEIGRVVAEMRKYRCEIEGGICVRQVEDLVTSTERRYFVLRGQPSASDSTAPIPEAVHAAAARVRSPFFSVDVVTPSLSISVVTSSKRYTSLRTSAMTTASSSA